MPSKKHRHLPRHESESVKEVQEVPAIREPEEIKEKGEKEMARPKLGDIVLVGVQSIGGMNPVPTPAIVVKVLTDTTINALVFVNDTNDVPSPALSSHTPWVTAIPFSNPSPVTEEEEKLVKDGKEIFQPRLNEWIPLADAPDYPTVQEEQEKAEKERNEKKLADLEKQLENAKKQKPAPDPVKVADLEKQIEDLKKAMEPVETPA